ncbi:hypothetical protein ACWEO2_28220 [Nocardia sp. NPDC004278]
MADDLGVTAMTVGTWLARFVQSWRDGLRDGERLGRPKRELRLTEDEAERQRCNRTARKPGNTNGLLPLSLCQLLRCLATRCAGPQQEVRDHFELQPPNNELSVDEQDSHTT